MSQEASSHADEDRKLREEVEARNRADSVAYSNRKMLREAATRCPRPRRRASRRPSRS